MTNWTDNEGRVSFALEDGVADVRLTRADKMNALDPAMFAGIAAAISELGRTAGLRAVVLSGEGRAFCAGLDMLSMASGGSNPAAKLTDRFEGPANLPQHVCWGWRSLAVPVIAAVHGVAMGGGFQLMSGADIRVADPATRMAIMEMKWGLVPDMAGIALWRGIARDDILRLLSYTAQEFTAEQAADYGFVTQLSATPLDDALVLAHRIAGKNPDAIRAMKRLANAMPDERGDALLMAESVEQQAIIRTANQMEAVKANFEKRAPLFAD